eukprot:5066603-Prymnesium_polylepis.1
MRAPIHIPACVAADAERDDAQFHAEKDSEALLSGGRAMASWIPKYQLPQEVLKKIWDVADVTKDGQLDLMEHRIALLLVRMAQDGKELPPAVPQVQQSLLEEVRGAASRATGGSSPLDA